jgi:hypothetical protein
MLAGAENVRDLGGLPTIESDRDTLAGAVPAEHAPE